MAGSNRTPAPEEFNDEQDGDEREQAQSVAREAFSSDDEDNPLDSEKVRGGIRDENEPDLIDRMRDMEQSGRIDMGAFKGEPNLDDDDDKYGERDGEDEG